jgi:hypothetical protein
MKTPVAHGIRQRSREAAAVVSDHPVFGCDQRQSVSPDVSVGTGAVNENHGVSTPLIREVQGAPLHPQFRQVSPSQGSTGIGIQRIDNPKNALPSSSRGNCAMWWTFVTSGASATQWKRRYAPFAPLGSRRIVAGREIISSARFALRIY